MADTVTIENVELIRPGVWNGVPISREDIQGVASAFEEVGGAIPVTLRLGHDARQAFAKMLVKAGLLSASDAAGVADDENGWPALGEVTDLSVRDEDGMLLGTFSNIPAKMAEWVRARRWPTRSVTLWPRKVIGGKVYHWWLDNVALLGSDTPAVDGLAPLGLSQADAGQGDALVVTFSASDADGLLALSDAQGSGDAGTPETALSQFIAALDATMDRYTPLIYGRKGGPMARQLFAAFTKALREAARQELPLSTGGTDVNPIEALRGALSLSADAPAADVVVALNGLDAATAGKIWEMAAALGIKDAGQLAVALGVMLGISTSDFDGIAAKVMELAGIQAPAPSEAPAPEAPAAPMSASAQPPAAPTADMVELSAAYTRIAGELETIKAERAREKALAKVHTDAQARGLALPTPIVNTLVTLSVAGDQAGYEAILGNVRGVPTNERGTTEAGEGQVVELSANDREAAKALGMTEADFLAAKKAAS